MPHLDAAYSYARYLARDGSVAEDVVQEAFLRSYKSFATCRGNEKAWLMAIVRNCWHDWVRANRRYVADNAKAEADQTSPEQDGPEAIVSDAEQASLLRDTLAHLPEPMREALVLRELEELSYREIAQLTGAPLGTVMSRLSRGREMLAKRLLEKHQGAREP